MTVSSCLPPVDGSSSDGEPLSPPRPAAGRQPAPPPHLRRRAIARSSFACVSRALAQRVARAVPARLWHRYVADQFFLDEKAPLARMSTARRHLLQRQPNRCAYQIGFRRVGALCTCPRSTICVPRLSNSRRGTSAARRRPRRTLRPAAPTAPYAALRAVSDDEYAVLRECDVSYFEVTIGEPPARDDDFVPQPECVAVGLASAKVRAQICKSLCAPLPADRAPARRSFRRTAGSPAGTASRSATTATTAAPSTARDRSRRSSAPSLASATSSAADSRCARAASLLHQERRVRRRAVRSRSWQLPLHAVVGLDARAPSRSTSASAPSASRSPTSRQRSTQSRAGSASRAHCALVVITSMKLC